MNNSSKVITSTDIEDNNKTSSNINFKLTSDNSFNLLSKEWIPKNLSINGLIKRIKELVLLIVPAQYNVKWNEKNNITDNIISQEILYEDILNIQKKLKTWVKLNENEKSILNTKIISNHPCLRIFEKFAESDTFLSIIINDNLNCLYLTDCSVSYYSR